MCHSGFVKSRGVLISSLTSSRSPRSPPGGGRAMWLTWFSISKRSSSCQCGRLPRDRGRTTRWWNRPNGARRRSRSSRSRLTSTLPSRVMTPVTIIRLVGSSIPNQAASTLDMATIRGTGAVILRGIDGNLGRLDRDPHLRTGIEAQLPHCGRRDLGHQRNLSADSHSHPLSVKIHVLRPSPPHVSRSALRPRQVQGDGARVNHGEHLALTGFRRGNLDAVGEPDVVAVSYS